MRKRTAAGLGIVLTAAASTLIASPALAWTTSSNNVGAAISTVDHSRYFDYTDGKYVFLADNAKPTFGGSVFGAATFRVVADGSTTLCEVDAASAANVECTSTTALMPGQHRVSAVTVVDGQEQTWQNVVVNIPVAAPTELTATATADGAVVSGVTDPDNEIQAIVEFSGDVRLAKPDADGRFSVTLPAGHAGATVWVRAGQPFNWGAWTRVVVNG